MKSKLVHNMGITWGKLAIFSALFLFSQQAFASMIVPTDPYAMACGSYTCTPSNMISDLGTSTNGTPYWKGSPTWGSIPDAYFEQATFSASASGYIYVVGSALTSAPNYIRSLGGSWSGDQGSTTASYIDSDGTTIYTTKYTLFAGMTGGVDFGSVFFTGGKVYAIISSSDPSIAFTSEAQYQAVALANYQSDKTRIISFTPNEGDVLSATSSVNFSLSAYINASDIGTVSGTGVRIILHNIDQNVLLSSFSSNDIVLYNALATSSGAFSFATSTMLDPGNYRIEATLDKSWLFGVLRNPFSQLNDVQSHQFIVGTSTFLGSISQNSFREAQAIYASSTATSTSALAGTCNLFSGFDTMSCLAFLFIPSSTQLNDTLVTLRASVLTRVPWGYFNRVYTIFQTSSTSTLPTLAMSIPTSATTHETVHFNMADMVTGGGTALDSVTSNVNHVTVRYVFDPFVKLLIAIGVLYTIMADLMGSHKHDHLS